MTTHPTLIGDFIMKTTKLIFGLAFSVLASSAFALPAVNTVNNSDMSKAPSLLKAAPSTLTLVRFAYRLTVLTTSVPIVWPQTVQIASVQTVRLPMVQIA